MDGPFHLQDIASPVAPTLVTERLVLRHVRPSDIDYFAETHADADVMRHVGGAVSREDAWRRAMTGAGFWGVLGIGLGAVERKLDGQTIGHVGFFDFQRDMQPSIAGEPGNNAMVCVRPPFLARGPSFGLVLLWEPLLEPQPQVAPLSRLVLPLVMVPEQFPPAALLATIVFFRVTVPAPAPE